MTSAARAAVQRFDALLAPERYTDGGPPPATLAHRAVVEAELTRLAGRSDPDLWARVADLWDGLGEPLEHVYAQWRRAEARLLGEAGRSEAARVLPAAAEAARELGARGLLGEIEDLARRARIPLVASGPEAAGDVPVPPVEAPLGLTGRELEVLALLAEGRTNREIGEALFMAPKTASVHVSRILAKLDVPSRVAAATKAYQLGIVRPATTSRPA